jgi:hypothetical protein
MEWINFILTKVRDDFLEKEALEIGLKEWTKFVGTYFKRADCTNMHLHQLLSETAWYQVTMRIIENNVKIIKFWQEQNFGSWKAEGVTNSDLKKLNPKPAVGQAENSYKNSQRS